MTALDARPGELGGEARDATAVAADPPARPDGLVLLGPQLGSGYVVPPALVRRGDGQVLQLTPLLYAVLEAVDGRRSLEEVAAVATERSGRWLDVADVRTLIDGKLRPLGLVCAPDGSVARLRKVNPLLRLRPRFVVADPRVTRRVTAPFAVLFHPVIATAVTLGFAAIAFWVLFEKGLASAAYQAFQRPGLLLAVFAVTVVSAGFHEFGHAAALRRGGGTPGAMGAGLYLVWPAFYTDVTDAYRLDRKARVRTDLGGLYFNAIVAVATYGVWLAVRSDALLLVIATQILQMLRQLPPTIRFDGYHLLADLTGVPDLFHRIGPTLRSFLPHRRGARRPPPLKLWVRVVVTAWVVFIVPLLAMATFLAAVALPHLLATTVHSIGVQAGGLTAYAHSHNPAGVLTKVLAILAVLVPAGGTIYMLVRVTRRYGTAVWRRTTGKPAQRAVAGVTAAAIVAGLGYLWWPHGNYRPIQPNQHGTVQDAFPEVRAGLFEQPVGLVAGQQLTTRTVWAGGPLPTKAHPALAVVLVPRGGTGPTWVFPFDRPDPPGPGDNQAMAVVTKDGGTVYDVAFALVWARSGTVLNRNEAYAFASCQGCRAVAISFQVVLVVGHASVIAPQNLSAAVAYNCIRCVTEALAVQLVVTLPGHLSGTAMHRLMRLWKEIRAFGRHLRNLTFAQIQARLAAYEARILAIVRPPGATSSPTSASASPVPSSPTPGVSTSSPFGGGTTTSPVATTTSAGMTTTPSSPAGPTTTSPSPSATTSSSPSATTSPTPSPSGTPSPTPSQ